MTQRTFIVDGTAWLVSVFGGYSVYERDECRLLFECAAPDGTRRRRLSRFSPLGSRRRAPALQELTDAELVGYYHQSQPSWTSAEVGYART